jgi:hypothetical protein
MKPKLRVAHTGAVEGAAYFCNRLHFQFLLFAVTLLALAALTATTRITRADEGGVSFWVPGTFGSLAAVPQQQPGWALTTIYYMPGVSAGSDVALAREFQIRNIPVNVAASLNANLHSIAETAWFIPSYAFATPVFGGQASVSLMGIYGHMNTSVSGTLTGTASVPGFGSIPLMRTDSISNSTTGFGDLYPQFTLRWNAGVNNFMTYVTGDIPVGDYNSSSLANIGIGHGALDGGVGYTYFNPQSGHEFSIVSGLTGNFENHSTGYTNGVDWHTDWGASQFLTKQVQVGLVGYFYEQVSPDRGCAPILCPFESRVIGVGPQFGYIFPISKDWQGYFNVKAYGEFDHANRPDGWNAWLTFVISPAAPTPAPPSMVTKAPPRS